MGINFDEIKKKAQDALDQNAGKIEEGIEKASGFAKSKFGQHADKIDNVSGKAKDFLHKNTGEGGQDDVDGPGPAGPAGPTGPTGPGTPPQ